MPAREACRWDWMAGLATATMVPSRPTIITPAATASSVSGGLPRPPRPLPPGAGRKARAGAVAAVRLARAAVMVLQQLAEAGRVRPGELAARLSVEAPHVPRQVQRLQQAGYATRTPDPDDRRAQLIGLTPAGRAAADRIREAGTGGMQAALAHWPPQELHQLATLLHRMVDDFLAYSAAEEPGQPER